MKYFKLFFALAILCYSCMENISHEETAEKKATDSVNTANIDSTDFQEKNSNDATVELKNGSAKFLWRKTVWDPEIKDSVSAIFINEEYCKTISDPEKAAIAYIATFVGNDCMWDGDAQEDRSNLKCRILTALDLGYQCSDKHLNYLRKWFRNDAHALEQLADCPTIPYTATIQSTFEYIDVKTTKNKIWISYTIRGVNMREGSSWREYRIDEFKLIDGALKSGAITTTKKIFTAEK